MKKLQNNFTTPEQSKRLLELGVPADSADCYFTEGGSLRRINDDNLFRDEFFEFYGKHYGYTPCWSVGRLIEIWELCVGVKFDRWSRRGVLLPLIEDCIEHIEFALNPYTELEFDFSKLEE